MENADSEMAAILRHFYNGQFSVFELFRLHLASERCQEGHIKTQNFMLISNLAKQL
jgi:hypothetical protein